MTGAMHAVNRFFGRRADLAAVEKLVAEGARLVSITGPGGTGKTRFAVELVAALERGPCAAREIHWCELAQATSASEIAAAVATAVGAAPPPGRDPVAHAAEVLAASGAAIVVLDELERLLPFVEETLGLWLRLGDVAFVVTSRTRLGLDGEFVHELGPLPVPSLVRADEASVEIDGADASAALDLFVDRARASGAGDAVDATDPDLLADIVRSLEGLPLAIELAAGRLRVLGPAELQRRLARSLTVLSGGRGRHATLATAIDDSWELLTAAERLALEGASVFEGGFDLEAAEAALDVGEAESTLDLVQALVDKSMIARRADPDGGQPRLSLLESLRAYGAERLRASGATARVRARHAEHYARIGIATLNERDGARDAATSSQARRRLVVERHNLGAALAEAAAREPDAVSVGIALDAALALHGAYRALGHIDSGASAPQIALDLATVAAARLGCARGELGDAAIRRKIALALLARADAIRNAGQVPEAIALADEALTIARALGDRELEASARATRGDGVARTDAAAALPDLEAALETLHAIGSGPSDRTISVTRALARTHLRLARLHHLAARAAVAIDHATAAAQAAVSIDDARQEAEALLFIAAARCEVGDAVGLRAACRRAQALSRDATEGYVPAFANYVLGVSHQEEGRFDEAADFFVESAARDRRLGNRRQEANTRMHLARLELERGRAEEAERGLVAVLAPLANVGDERPRARALIALAAARVRLGDREGARRALEDAAHPADEILVASAAIVSEMLRVAEGRGGEADSAAAAVIEDVATRSEDVRTMLRVARGAALSRAVESGAPALEVGPAGAWFRVGAGAVVDLSRQRAKARILAVLVERRSAAPGTPASMDELFCAGWPGEQVRMEAAGNRVYVSVSALRSLGLRGFLLNGDGGWLLDPRATVVIATSRPR